MDGCVATVATVGTQWAYMHTIHHPLIPTHSLPFLHLSQITVDAGRASGASCVARGPGLLRAGSGVPAIVAVLIQDDLGNPKSVDDPHRAASTVHGRGLHAKIERWGWGWGGCVCGGGIRWVGVGWDAWGWGMWTLCGTLTLLYLSSPILFLHPSHIHPPCHPPCTHPLWSPIHSLSHTPSLSLTQLRRRPPLPGHVHRHPGVIAQGAAQRGCPGEVPAGAVLRHIQARVDCNYNCSNSNTSGLVVYAMSWRSTCRGCHIQARDGVVDIE